MTDTLPNLATTWVTITKDNLQPWWDSPLSRETDSALFTLKRNRGQCGGWATETIVFLCELFVIAAIGPPLVLYVLVCVMFDNWKWPVLLDCEHMVNLSLSVSFLPRLLIFSGVSGLWFRPDSPPSTLTSWGKLPSLNNLASTLFFEPLYLGVASTI